MAGELDSWTVSSLGGWPLGPRGGSGAFVLCVGSSGSLVVPSSGTASRGGEAGDELWTMMAGVDWVSGFLICERSEFLRECEKRSSAGGGDLRRGEMGQWGVESVVTDLDGGLEERGARAGSGVDDAGAGVSSGMLVAEWARCTAGVGVVEFARLEVRLGLASVLLLRERKPGLTPEAAAALRW